MHAHTRETDGRHSIEEVARAAQGRGHAHLAVTDHSKRVAVPTDAHGIGGLEFMRFGIDQARRGWLAAKDAIDTRRCPEMLKLL